MEYTFFYLNQLLNHIQNMGEKNKKILKRNKKKDKNKKEYDEYGDNKDNRIDYEKDKPPHW